MTKITKKLLIFFFFVIAIFLWFLHDAKASFSNNLANNLTFENICR